MSTDLNRDSRTIRIITTIIIIPPPPTTTIKTTTVKLPVCLIKHLGMSGSRCTGPLIFNYGTTWSWVVDIRSYPIYFQLQRTLTTLTAATVIISSSCIIIVTSQFLIVCITVKLEILMGHYAGVFNQVFVDLTVGSPVILYPLYVQGSYIFYIGITRKHNIHPASLIRYSICVRYTTQSVYLICNISTVY